MSGQHATRSAEPSHEPVPAPARLTVGAADDVAEADADRLAEQALSNLAQQPAVELQFAPGRISRAHQPAPAGGGAVSGAIGRAGGALDAGTQLGIDSARGSGRPLEGEVRSSMETAFGADFSRVRIHDTPTASRISRSISATAFTTGNDIFFSQGAYQPQSPEGQHVLAHELAHTVQQKSSGIQRLWPFDKSDEDKTNEAAAKAKKKALIKARAEMKAKDAAARLEAKRINETTKAEKAKIAGSYAGAKTAKNDKSGQHKTLERDFQMYLDREQAARAQARHDITGGVGTAEKNVAADLAEEEAADRVWSGAPVRIRAFRPLRFDEFDRALNEVRQVAAQGLADEQGEAASLLEANEKAHGAPLKPEKAVKKVKEKRQLDRAQVRAAESKGQNPIDAAAADMQKAEATAAAKISKRPMGVGETERAKADAARKGPEEKYGPNDDLEDAKTYTGYAATAAKTAGGATKTGTKGVVHGHVGGATEGPQSAIAEVVGASVAGLGYVMALISDLLAFAGTVTDIKRGIADPGAKLQATRQAVAVVSDAASVTRAALYSAREGVQNFGGAATVATEAGSALPIVGLIISVLAAIDDALELVPRSQRLGTGLESVDVAVLAGKAPLAASLDRVNSRNAQLVEQSTFSLAKNSTMIGLHVAEIASAGGFGIPMAAKLAVGITSLAHSLGHTIYDTVGESRSSDAKKAFSVKHEEGASRNVVKYDIGSSVDIVIVAAQKHKLDYARKILLEYGVTETEITSMRLHELREKVLDGLEAEGDPKTVKEKIDEAKESISETLGIEKKPTGQKKEEKSTLAKVVAAPVAVGSGIAALPGMIGTALTDVKHKHSEAKELVDAKNKLNYGGNSGRGIGARAQHMVRDSKKIEKSYAKVRFDLAADGADVETLPRTAEDKKKRAKVAAAKIETTSQGGARKIDPAFIQRVTDASDVELFTIFESIDRKDPLIVPNLEFLEYEATRRSAEVKKKAKR
ncbi:uncharacterized protein DUF4157 [Jatrophihabitans sp. GAS493]|nr:DUF4157 domain-containing protein [Jatrophihabitans sp. GAS493]SOD70963.1 uncharacterized protein DUF4157 [Jatrophihabitans sp. GAS493]